MNKSFLALAAVGLLAGCASNPWPKYEEAVRCHLDNKGPASDKIYESVIKIDPKVQGIHSSYGVHLLQEGRAAEAQAEFDKEKANYPQFADKGLLALAGAKSDATAVPAKVEAPAAPAAAPASVNTVPATTPVKTPAAAPTGAAKK